jgi:hypothetical protein
MNSSNNEMKWKVLWPYYVHEFQIRLDVTHRPITVKQGIEQF